MLPIIMHSPQYFTQVLIVWGVDSITIHTLVSTSVHCSSMLLSGEEPSLVLLVDPESTLWASRWERRGGRDRGVWGRGLSLGLTFGRLCLRISTSVNWIECPPPLVLKISPYVYQMYSITPSLIHIRNMWQSQVENEH